MMTEQEVCQAFDELGKKHEVERAALMREIVALRAERDEYRGRALDAETKLDDQERKLNKAGRLVLSMLLQAGPWDVGNRDDC